MSGTKCIKVVLKLDLHDDEEKKKAFKAVSGIQGIDSISMDMEDKKLTVIGSVDPVDIVRKLRKQWRTKILLVGPEKDKKKKDGDKKDKDGENYVIEMIDPYNHFRTPRYYVQSAEENPNGCVIC